MPETHNKVTIPSNPPSIKNVTVFQDVRRSMIEARQDSMTGPTETEIFDSSEETPMVGSESKKRVRVVTNNKQSSV